MKRALFAAAAIFWNTLALSAEGDVWATALTERQNDGRRVVFRYVENFATPVDRKALGQVVVLSWRYQSEGGMPAKSELVAMYELEDLLLKHLEASGRARLVLISTGDNLRMWTYYAQSEVEFRSMLATALQPPSRFPVKVSARTDPEWTEYERFKGGVQKR